MLCRGQGAGWLPGLGFRRKAKGVGLGFGYSVSGLRVGGREQGVALLGGAGCFFPQNSVHPPSSSGEAA